MQERNIKLRSLTENVDAATATGRLMFNFLGAIAEYFLDLDRERTKEGLKAALARGLKGGRRRLLAEKDLEIGRALLSAGTITVAEVAKRLMRSVGLGAVNKPTGAAVGEEQTDCAA